MVATLFLLAQSRAPLVLDLAINGVARRALVVAPTPTARSGAPLLLVFHGHGGNAHWAVTHMHVHQRWPEACVAYLEGLPTRSFYDKKGEKNGWQSTSSQNSGRDIAFVQTLLDKLQADYGIDPKRVYAMGHSNGGVFMYVLWQSMPQRFAAFGIFNGNIRLDQTLASPKPAFVVAGQSDPLVRFPLMQRSIETLKTVDQVDAHPEDRQGASLYRGANGNDIETYIYVGGHTFNQAAVGPMVDFFKSH